MAYQLQPGLQQISSKKVLPPVNATDMVIEPPQPSSLNYCCRPSTMVWGTAPYKAGKGAPGAVIDVSDELRPQSTTQFGKVYANNSSGGYFPFQDMKCSVPLRTKLYNSESTRAAAQNELFHQRYCKK